MPEWFGSIAGETFGPFLWVFAVAGFVCLVAVVSLRVLKAYGSPSMLAGTRPQEKRLRIVESVGLGERRRLVLVRCDGTEHLILVGGSSDVVVERGVGGTAHDREYRARAAKIEDRQDGPVPRIDDGDS